MPKQERITYLLSKLYNGNINRSELDELQMFFNNKIESDLYFNNSLDSINQTIPLIKEETSSSMWNTIEQHTKIRKLKNRRNFQSTKWIAAVSILILGITTLFFQFQPPTFHIAENNSKLPKTLYLPDSSKIILSAHSSIKYAKDFNKNRNVSLFGEAFFEVKKDTMHPFIIKTNEITTKVLGTSFNVKTTESFVKVVVNTGLVQVNSYTSSYMLHPNEMATFSKNTKSLAKENTLAEIHNLCIEKEIFLKEITIEQLAILFEQLYQRDFVFKDESVKTKKLYSLQILNNDPIDKLINRINYLNEVELKIKDTNELEVKTKN